MAMNSCNQIKDQEAAFSSCSKDKSLDEIVVKKTEAEDISLESVSQKNIIIENLVDNKSNIESEENIDEDSAEKLVIDVMDKVKDEDEKSCGTVEEQTSSILNDLKISDDKEIIEKENVATKDSESIQNDIPDASNKISNDLDDKEPLPDVQESTEHDPDWVEERFRVDRKNLEQMLQAAADGKGLTGDEFFGGIMEKTGVKIAWPSKIKIGARSKKDPHVKVSGKREAVELAKGLVMQVLDTKSTRVTLKMDVAHTEHSHVIGKGGNNVRRVMEDTGCHIHFPDSNRTNTSEKSNQVSIAGQPAGVECARDRIRALLPVVISFDLTISTVLPDPNSSSIQRIVQVYGIGVQFKQRAKTYCTTTCTVRGSSDNLTGLMEGTRKLMQHLIGPTMVHVTSHIEVAPQQHAYMVGRNVSNVNQIVKHTGIRFPDHNSLPRKSIVVTGPIESVVVARQQLMGCLPLVLMFDVKETDDISTETERNNRLMEELDVFISVKLKPRQPSKSVIVKSVERNVHSMFEARRRMLGLESSGLKTSPSINLMSIPTATPPLIQLSQTSPTVAAARVNPHYIGILQPSGVALLNGTLQRTANVAAASALLPQNWSTNQATFHAHQQQKLALRAQLKAQQQQQYNAAAGVVIATASSCKDNHKPVPDPPLVQVSRLSPNPVVQKTPSPLIDLSDSSNLVSTSQLRHQHDNGALNRWCKQQQVSQNKLTNTPSSNTSFNNSLNSQLPIQNRKICEDQKSIPKISSEDLRSLLQREPITHSQMTTMYGPRNTPMAANTSNRLQQSSDHLTTIPSSASNHHPKSPSSSASSIDLQTSMLNFHARNNNSFHEHINKKSLLHENRIHRNNNNNLLGNSQDLRERHDNTLTIPPGFERVIKESHDHPLMNDHDYEWVKQRAFELMKQPPVADKIRTPTDQWSGLGFSQSMPNPKFKNHKFTNELETTFEVDDMTSYYVNVSEVDTSTSTTQFPTSMSNAPSTMANMSGLKSSSALLSWRERNFSHSYNPNSFTKRRYHQLQAHTGVFNKHPPLPSPPHPNDEPSMLGSSQSRVLHLQNDLRETSRQPSVDEDQSYGGQSRSIELRDVLTYLHLEKYMLVFTNQEVDLQTFLTLNDADLTEIGITAFGPRKKILLAIEELKKHRNRTHGAGCGNNSLPSGRTPTILDGFFHDDSDKLLQQFETTPISTLPHVSTESGPNSRLLHYSRGIASHSGRW